MLFFCYLLLINLCTFFLFWLDKWKAVHEKWRIREAVLLGASALGGAFGGLLAMYLFRHKTKKPKFYMVMPVLCLLEAVLVVFYLTGAFSKEKKSVPTAKVVESAEPEKEKEEPKEVFFSDVKGEEHEFVLNPNVPKHAYDLSLFQKKGEFMAYEDEDYTSRVGVDVSKYQGKINWKKVKKAGISFVFIRLGYRGYGKAGRLVLDEWYVRNIKRAKAAGVEVGVYFFSQAIDEKEAEEEAEFVLKYVKGYKLQLPIVYDPESIPGQKARTDQVSGAQFTKNTKVFCERIKSAGYEPMIYSNMMWEAYKLDLEYLKGYPVWYADYQKFPQTPYLFEFWQYTESAKVSGIPGRTDLNIQLIKK